MDRNHQQSAPMQGDGTAQTAEQRKQESLTQLQEVLARERKKKRILKTVVTVLLICVVLTAVLYLIQCSPVRNAIKDVPVVGKLPALVDRIPVIGQIDDVVDKIIENIPGAENPEDLIPTYTHHDPFEKPNPRPEEEIEATGITAEDVLAIYDQLAWDFGLERWHYEFPGVDDSYFSAQFDRIDVLNSHHFHPELTDTYDYPFYGIGQLGHKNNFFWLREGDEKTFRETYDFNFHQTSVYGDNPNDSTVLGVGAHKDQFEPVMDSFGVEKFFLTEEFIENSGHPTSWLLYDYLNTDVYKPFAITRETIENATEEQLYLLYDLAKSIRSICLDQEYPNIPPRGFGGEGK